MAKNNTTKRATWKGSISFGLIYIPVAVYPATREEKISFRQLRASDLSPVKYKKVAEADGVEVPADQIIKGYEYERGRFITLKDTELAAVKVKSTHSIEITDFVDQAEVDPKFFYKPYYLEPQKGGDKAYALLHKALVGTGKIGIAKVVISSREYLAAVKPDGNALVLELMHFDSEVLSLPDGAIPAVATNENELKMAKALVKSMSSDWQPDKYLHEYRGAVMELIDKKANNENIDLPPMLEQKTAEVDLLKALEASLALTEKSDA